VEAREVHVAAIHQGGRARMSRPFVQGMHLGEISREDTGEVRRIGLGGGQDVEPHRGL
jgi:hypothetical protein